MDCAICKETFNMITKQPVLLPCCNESICRQCQLKLIEAPQQGNFKCPMDFCGEVNQCEVPFKPNRAIERFLKDQLGIFCDAHPSKNVDCFCKNHKKLMCSGCIMPNHQNHIQTVIKIDKKSLNDFNQLIIDKLIQERERINFFIRDFESYQKNEKQSTAFQYQNIVAQVQTMLISSYKTNEEKQSIQFNGTLFDYKNEQNEEEKEDVYVNQLDSTLIKQENLGMLSEWIFEKTKSKFKLELIYRGTRDGFDAQSFHKRMENEQSTLHVFKSEHQKIFGGYMSLKWITPEKYIYQEDPNAFIFSLTEQTKHDPFQNKSLAVKFDKDALSMFSLDFQIHSNCNKDKKSWTKLGYTYTLPNGVQYESKESKEYLTGSEYYLIEEIEIFSVIQA